MTTFLDKLNLRPQERRLVVFVGLLVFVALNIFFVVPQFGKVDFWENRKKAADKKLGDYQTALAEVEKNKVLLKKLEETGGVIDQGTEDAILTLQRDVTSLAQMSGMTPESSTPGRSSSGRTNSFFDEAALRLTASAGEKELVEFLYNLGSRNALVRVRNMSLQPEPSQFKLKANIELVKSFPRKTIAKGGAKTASITPGAAKATTPASATNSIKTANAATNAPSTNWFKKLIARLTPGSGSAPKTNAVAAPAKTAPGSTVKFSPKTNATPKTPNLPSPK